VILLDMNGTFMFGHDRFGPAEDYFATYCALGGRRLARDELLDMFLPSLEELLRIYEAPERFDDFPALGEVFARHGAAGEDIALLERTFAAHEIGSVPRGHASCIERLSATHALGVVSNICAHPDLWLRICDSSGVFERFTALVFSSEGRSIKPSPALFRRAMALFPPHAPTLFVGDSLERDIIPAKALGMSTAWIAPLGSAHPAADRVIEGLPELLTLSSDHRA
jgi:FMN phosphatase YigB (HAD superfamily)